MPLPLIVVLPLVIAGVLIASGVAKLRHPDDLDGWAALGVPAPLRRRWLLLLHPWGEIALGAVMAVSGGILGLLASLASLVLMATYLVMIARVARRGDGTPCACFGAPKPVSRMTVWRNAWLTLVAAGAVAASTTLPAWGGVLALGEWWWMLGLLVTAITVALVMWPEPGALDAAPGAGLVVARSMDGDLDYIRTRTPAVPVLLADGQSANLRSLASARPLLLLAVSETCAACAAILPRVPEWRDRLPEVDVRLLLQTPPGVGPLASVDEPQSLHDTDGNVRRSIADWPTPTAVLFGVDGMLAGGPVWGGPAISAFIEEVDDVLHGEA